MCCSGCYQNVFPPKVTPMICQLHASVFSKSVHFGPNIKELFLYVHCKIRYVKVKLCACNGCIIKIWLRPNTFEIFSPDRLHYFYRASNLLFYTGYSITTYHQTVKSQLKQFLIISSSLVLSYHSCPGPAWPCLISLFVGAKNWPFILLHQPEFESVSLEPTQSFE